MNLHLLFDDIYTVNVCILKNKKYYLFFKENEGRLEFIICI